MLKRLYCLLFKQNHSKSNSDEIDSDEIDSNELYEEKYNNLYDIESYEDYLYRMPSSTHKKKDNNIGMKNMSKKMPRDPNMLPVVYACSNCNNYYTIEEGAYLYNKFYCNRDIINNELMINYY